MEIRKLSIEEMYASIPFVCEVFDKYEAVNYPEDGKNAFKQAISSKEYLEMLSAYGAFLDEKLIGIIATRNQGTHVALFFVDGQYHKQGIGRSLFEVILNLPSGR